MKVNRKSGRQLAQSIALAKEYSRRAVPLDIGSVLRTQADRARVELLKRGVSSQALDKMVVEEGPAAIGAICEMEAAFSKICAGSEIESGQSGPRLVCI